MKTNVIWMSLAGAWLGVVGMAACSADDAANDGALTTPDSGTSEPDTGASEEDSGGGGSPDASGPRVRARAMLTKTTLDSGAGVEPAGTVDFEEQPDGKITMSVTVSGTSPGLHGLHIHEGTSCGNTTADGGDAGPAGAARGHWNPADAGHGYPTDPGHHPGDFGNVVVGDAGTGVGYWTSGDFDLKQGSPASILGHAIILHAKNDEGADAQPAGNSGGRSACGLIEPL